MREVKASRTLKSEASIPKTLVTVVSVQLAMNRNHREKSHRESRVETSFRDPEAWLQP